MSKTNFFRITIALVTMLVLMARLPFAVADGEGNYHFDKDGITREVLENYLEKSITMAHFLTPSTAEGNRPYLYHADDERMLKNMGAKFVGRAIYRWGSESTLLADNFWSNAHEIIQRMHADDPEIIFQACLFEVITPDINKVPIPEWTFQAYNLPVEKRNFSYDAMLNREGKFVNHWGKSSVPDISRPETQLWFYYLAVSYMEIGCEAFHLGQVELMGMNDPRHDAWAAMVTKIRQAASTKARRHWVLLDAHVPKGGLVKDGKSLLDFNSFPLRIKEVVETPTHGQLEKNHLDSLYGKSQGCLTPSGWQCDHLPYLVELDNFGRSGAPNVANVNNHFVWGWDEISWFSQQPESYRNEWLQYAQEWLRENDANGHLQMPGNRIITCPNQTENNYHANTRGTESPFGYSQEEIIKKLWSGPPHRTTPLKAE